MRSFFFRRTLLIAALLAGPGLLGSLPAHADSGYPSKPIRLFVGFPPGGGTDIMARAIAQKLSLALGVGVIVENYTGANGNIASERAAHSPADGYTIMMVSVSHAVNASLYHHLGYDPVKDFTPIIAVASVPMVLSVNASSPIKSVAQLITEAKAEPGKLTFSSGGIGAPEQIAGDMLQQIAGIKLTHVPYKGSGASIADQLGGRISLSFNTMPSVLPYLTGGSLRPLAVGDRRRSSQLPNVPTLIESGVPGFVMTSWYGLVAPAGTPKDVVLRLNTEIGKILTLDDVKTLFTRFGAQPSGGTPAQFGTFLNGEFAKFAKIVATFDLAVD